MPVSIPLDKICVRSGVFCPRCQRLLDEQRYTSLEVEVMRALLDVEKRLRDVDVKYVKSYRIDDLLYVLVEARPGIPAWLGGEIYRRVKEYGIERVVVVEYRRDPRRMLEQLLNPYPLLGLEEAFLPDGSTVAIIRVPEEARGFLESFKGRIVLRLAEKLLGKQVYVEYEKVSVERLKPEWLGIQKVDPRKLFDSL